MRICQYCGQEVTSQRGTPTCNKCHELYTLNYNRIKAVISREKPKHTSEELEAIKKKYAGGVPAGEIEQWIRGNK